MFLMGVKDMIMKRGARSLRMGTKETHPGWLFSRVSLYAQGGCDAIKGASSDL
jgi:hypothetical protein